MGRGGGCGKAGHYTGRGRQIHEMWPGFGQDLPGCDDHVRGRWRAVVAIMISLCPTTWCAGAAARRCPHCHCLCGVWRSARRAALSCTCAECASITMRVSPGNAAKTLPRKSRPRTRRTSATTFAPGPRPSIAYSPSRKKKPRTSSPACLGVPLLAVVGTMLRPIPCSVQNPAIARKAWMDGSTMSADVRPCGGLSCAARVRHLPDGCH